MFCLCNIFVVLALCFVFVYIVSLAFSILFILCSFSLHFLICSNCPFVGIWLPWCPVCPLRFFLVCLIFVLLSLSHSHFFFFRLLHISLKKNFFRISFCFFCPIAFSYMFLFHFVLLSHISFLIYFRDFIFLSHISLFSFVFFSYFFVLLFLFLVSAFSLCNLPWQIDRHIDR